MSNSHSNTDILRHEDKKQMDSFFSSDVGKLFIKTLEDMHENHINLAKNMYLKVVNPNEQIAAQVNQATGVEEVLDFIQASMNEVREVKKKEEEKKSEL